MNTNIFISYKTGEKDKNTLVANMIRDLLDDHEDYTVWMDDKLMAGKRYNTQLYEQIGEADVLVLIYTEAAANSEWVKREIAVARGARTSILPVLVEGDNQTMNEELGKFDLQDFQWVDFRQGSREQKDYLFDSIEQIKDEARENRRRWLESTVRLTESSFFKAEDDKAHAAYRLADRPATTVYLATGDITRLRGIDVLVNSENNYMQMSRTFEPGTVSRALRWAGGFADGRFYDTIQRDLNDQVWRSDHRYRVPVTATAVIPTHAGHPRSMLVDDNRVRYIFHTATVIAHGDLGDGNRRNRQIAPITQPDQIQNAVKQCLREVDRINENHGIISPEGTARRIQEDNQVPHYQPITSIVFPVFGIGHGGAAFDVVFPHMLEGFRDYLFVRPETTLQGIHICVYDGSTLDYAEKAMLEKFDRA
jgi:O-acetyl-ADP-ribose deacetylase (regulator of RNase III)